MGSCLLAAEAQATTVFSSRSLSKSQRSVVFLSSQLPIWRPTLEAEKRKAVAFYRKEGEFRRIPAVGVFGCILLLPPPQLLCEGLPEEKRGRMEVVVVIQRPRG